MNSEELHRSSSVPQGGILSPFRFNVYTGDIPLPPKELKLVTYADDCTVMASGSTVPELEERINPYLHTPLEWFTANDLELSPGKSSATLLTTFSKEINRELKIKIDGCPVPTVKNPKILGVIFDGLHSFKANTDSLVNKVKKRNNVLKAIGGTTWGKEKEILMSTYKATGRATLNYAAPVWTASLSETNWQKLQTCQNAAMRSITGCVRMTHSDDLHNECKLLPVKDHCQLLSKQHLLQSQMPCHPNHGALDESRERDMRKTLASEFNEEVQEATNMDNPKWRKRGMIFLHTKTVRSSRGKMRLNRVLEAQAPPVAESERTLQRETRSRLAQLRSGFSPLLNSYMNRIDDKIENRCPDCSAQGHDTRHLFNCKMKKTTLNVESLWRDPVAAANFLKL